jgi:LemA protein
VNTFVVVGLVAAAVAVLVLLGYNRLVRLRNRVDAAAADLDVRLRRRYDLIPNLIETVQGYAAHERALFEAVTAARAAGQAATHPAEQARAEERITTEVRRVIAVAEAYPELKADQRFRALADELTSTEDTIAFSRQLYNDTVESYATACQRIPTVLIARPFGFEPPEFFAADADARGPVVTRFEN